MNPYMPPMVNEFWFAVFQYDDALLCATVMFGPPMVFQAPMGDSTVAMAPQNPPDTELALFDVAPLVQAAPFVVDVSTIKYATQLVVADKPAVLKLLPITVLAPVYLLVRLE